MATHALNDYTATAVGERTSSVFGNPMPPAVIRKAQSQKAGFIRRFGADGVAAAGREGLALLDNPVLGPRFGLKTLTLPREAGAAPATIDAEAGAVVGTIRMGYGHYRIAMAAASALRQRGRTPYWFDLNGFSESLGGKIVARLNELYSLGSRLSQRYRLFDKLYWEPLNSEGFKKLSYNAVDQSMAELFAPLYASLPRDLPFVATHAWPAQGAVHAGLSRVVDMIPDNWPMALHLAEGAIHAVQSPSAYMGYRALRDMAGGGLSAPLPAAAIRMTGHFIDHEIVAGLPDDTQARVKRLDRGEPKRVLFSLGGAGAQLEYLASLVRGLLPLVEEGKATLYLNFGDHASSWERFERELFAPGTRWEALLTRHFGDWAAAAAFAEASREGKGSAYEGVHAFLNADKFAAVYATNLLMRASDFLVTKPSELAYYPVPKLMIKRVGGHERWGAIRAAELGDGSYELESAEAAMQMLRLMVEERDLLYLQNECITRSARTGIYDGAYKAVDLALDRA